MEPTVNINGRITSARDGVVSVLDHGFLFGDGVYETLRTYDRRPFQLGLHLDRLKASAAMLQLRMPVSGAQWTERIQDTMRAAGDDGEAYIRLLLTRGVGDLSYDPAACPEPTVIVLVKAFVAPPREWYDRGVRIVVASVVRNHPRAINPRIKSNNLLNNVLAMQQAIREGGTEALMLNYRGELAECAQSNVFLVRRGEVVTPELEAGLLEGVTRRFLFDLGRQVGIPIREAVLHEADLTGADEAFLTSTTREVLPVVQVGSDVIGAGEPGPLTRRLHEAFVRAAHQEARAAP